MQVPAGEVGVLLRGPGHQGWQAGAEPHMHNEGDKLGGSEGSMRVSCCELAWQPLRVWDCLIICLFRISVRCCYSAKVLNAICNVEHQRGVRHRVVLGSRWQQRRRHLRPPRRGACAGMPPHINRFSMKLHAQCLPCQRHNGSKQGQEYTSSAGPNACVKESRYAGEAPVSSHNACR